MTVEQLEQRGFVTTEYDGSILVSCDQCIVLVVNGGPTHEDGCENKMHECAGCNEWIPQRQRYCCGWHKTEAYTGGVNMVTSTVYRAARRHNTGLCVALRCSCCNQPAYHYVHEPYSDWLRRMARKGWNLKPGAVCCSNCKEKKHG